MKIDFGKRFIKQYAKLSEKKKDRVDETILLFELNTTHPKLKNHALKGKRAISAGGDMRLIFQEYEGYTLVLFLEVGSHNQVY